MNKKNTQPFYVRQRHYNCKTKNISSMKTIISILLLFSVVSFSSCKKTEIINNETKMIQLDKKSAQLIEADNAFGLKAFQKIREMSDKENIMVSPLSISVALAMAYNGADGKTKTEMEEVMHLNGLTVNEINASYKMLIAALQSLDDDVVFEIANAIFYAQEFSVKQDFLNINQQNYDARVEGLNFNLPSAVDAINTWVATKTRDKIKSIIEKLNSDDRMVLLNAIYFNGIWTKKFDEKGTKELPFYKTNGVSIEAATMNKEDKLDYQTNSLFSAVKIPYGSGQYNMLIFLPSDIKNSKDVIDNLTADNWKTWMKNFETKDKVVVKCPGLNLISKWGLIEF
jgi:serine protease inhibitor